MKIVFLGTNGWFDSATGNTLSVLIDSKEAYIILDAGNGIYKADKYIKDTKKPVYLFLSHYHIDHISGLHIMVKFKFPQGMDIVGPPGLGELCRRVINRPYTVPLSRLSMRTRLIELTGDPGIRFLKGFMKLDHVGLCYGYRFELEKKTIAFCTDTGKCANMYKLAKGADLLIAECTFLEGQDNPKWPHLNPETAAAIAKKAGAKKLALTHFDAGLYTALGQRKESERVAKKIFKNTFATYDNMVIVL